jgi:L-rhamnose mutarotase
MAVFEYFKSVQRMRNEAIRQRWWKLEEAIMNYLHQKNK